MNIPPSLREIAVTLEVQKIWYITPHNVIVGDSVDILHTTLMFFID